MASRKVQRATEDVKRELSLIISELKDPRITGVISIVNLVLSSDYSHCTVYISSLDGMAGAQQAVEGLQSASGYIRRQIGARLKLRKIPSFHFMADDGIAYSADIGKLIAQNKGKEPKDETPSEDN